MGPSNILVIALKTCVPEFAACLVKLLHNSYNAGSYPGKLSSKAIERVINNAIKQHLLSNNLTTNAQFGFCQDHSAPDLITDFVRSWTKELNSK
eukprot:g30865.t1